MSDIAITTYGPSGNSRAFYVRRAMDSLNGVDSRIYAFSDDIMIVHIAGAGNEAKIEVTIRNMGPAESQKLWINVFALVATAVGWDPGSHEVAVRR